MIALVLVELRPGTPRFAWGTDATPLAGLVAVENLARTAQVALLVLGPLLAGAAVLRANVQTFLPGALLLFGSGLVGLGFLRRRKC